MCNPLWLHEYAILCLVLSIDIIYSFNLNGKRQLNYLRRTYATCSYSGQLVLKSAMFVRSLKSSTEVKLNVSTNLWFISISSWCARDMLRWRWCCTCSRRTPGSRHSRAHTAMTATKNIFIVNQKIFLKSELFFRCHAMTVAGLIITWESSQRGSATFTSSLPILSAGLEPSTCNVTYTYRATNEHSETFQNHGEGPC